MIVEVKQGKLEGTKGRSVLSDEVYYSFLGIPYAKPPIGDLRFRPPVPHEKWDGVRSAQTEGNLCFQKNTAALLSSDPRLPKYIGSEDCLYLNIFTPEPPSQIKNPKAVIIFVHGGAYQVGSGGMATRSPDFLIEHDIIVVTFNYRLNILGFLNMGTMNCPGNLGLKDQVLAFQWIKDNISSFGGDPENITIYGQSAGATSVIHHMASPLSKGLFNKVIAMSPIIMLPEPHKRNPVEMGFRVGQILGYEGSDPQELVEFLKKQSPENLLDASSVIQKNLQCVAPGRCSSVVFPPSVELIKANAFLPDTTANLLKTAEPKPFLTGMNNKEGTLVYWMFRKETMKALEEDFTNIIRNNFKCEPSKMSELASEVKQFYFGNRDVGPDTANEFVDLYSDIYFISFYDMFDFILKSEMPVYVYQFTFDGKSPTARPMRSKSVKGAGHGDEIPYIFYPRAYLQKNQIEEPERTMIQNMCALLTNFAKTGNPTPSERSVAGVEWSPCKSDRPCYLQIDEDLKLIPGHIFANRRAFLKSLFPHL